MLTTLAAPRQGPKLRRGRARDVESAPPPSPLPLTRVTMVRPRPFADDAAATDWLERVSRDREMAASLAREAVQRLNRALHVHRTAAGDPHVADVDPARAVAVRFGFGTGEEVADGRWRQARELAEDDRRRLLRRDYEALRPQERIAAVLGGRERVGAHEELLLRARGDLDAGRLGTCALGLHAGLEALMGAGGGVSGLDPALVTRLRDAAATAAEARSRVLAGAVDGDLDAESLEHAVRATEAAMRRRALE